MNRKLAPAFLLLSALLASGCSRGDMLESHASGPAADVVLIGNGQEAVAGTELPDPVTVKVLDAVGRPVSGQIVIFVVVAGGGDVFAGTAVTNAHGLAREWWTLGPAPGPNRLEARGIDSATGGIRVFGTFEAVGL